MEHHQVLGDKVQDGNGINDRYVCRLCVYAGSSWTLQKPKGYLREMMNKKP
jgi:hypothetical protein